MSQGVNARVRLFGNLRAFVETYLRGLLTWDACVPSPGIPNDPVEHGRRNPLGKFKEIATIKFGEYELSVHSAEDDPPLGWIRLEAPGNTVIEGALDRTTWERVGEFIRTKGIRKYDNGRRTDAGWLSAG